MQTYKSSRSNGIHKSPWQNVLSEYVVVFPRHNSFAQSKKRSSAPLSHQITGVCKARLSFPEASVYGQ